MSKFLSPLRVEEVEDNSNDGRGTWSLLDDLVYQSDVAGRAITAPKGMLTDFASVPRFPPIAFALCGDIGHPASVIHDSCYIAQTMPRAIADAVLMEALVVCGVPAWKARMMWAAVRIAGGSHWNEPGQSQPQSVADALSP
jgi:Protein of unknown function (DUF1353)